MKAIYEVLQKGRKLKKKTSMDGLVPVTGHWEGDYYLLISKLRLNILMVLQNKGNWSLIGKREGY